MKKYIALEKSYGFQKRFWEAGDTVELPDDHKCPEYFKLMTEPVPAPEPVEELKTFSEINQERQKSAPKTGMAHTAPEPTAKSSKPSKPKK
jgi:hypothetical protein